MCIRDRNSTHGDLNGKFALPRRRGCGTGKQLKLCVYCIIGVRAHGHTGPRAAKKYRKYHKKTRKTPQSAACVGKITFHILNFCRIRRRDGIGTPSGYIFSRKNAPDSPQCVKMSVRSDTKWKENIRKQTRQRVSRNSMPPTAAGRSP